MLRKESGGCEVSIDPKWINDLSLLSSEYELSAEAKACSEQSCAWEQLLCKKQFALFSPTLCYKHLVFTQQAGGSCRGAGSPGSPGSAGVAAFGGPPGMPIAIMALQSCKVASGAEQSRLGGEVVPLRE